MHLPKKIQPASRKEGGGVRIRKRMNLGRERDYRKHTARLQLLQVGVGKATCLGETDKPWRGSGVNEEDREAEESQRRIVRPA